MAKIKEKYKTFELIEWIQDLHYTQEDKLKLDEIENRLLELDKLKKEKIQDGS